VRILRYRYRIPPRWALDGGNGSVVSVDPMTEDKYEMAWKIMFGMTSIFDGYSIDLEQVHSYMEHVAETLNLEA
jgi:hypothetical protein